ncbi:DUF3784 domain-containing protein [Limnospira fusiformis]|uniref:DUF3784 domain-containing protein n=1 Tax=Limnospira fusiformis TaxID=54297 RepID=UPI0034E0B3A1
MSKPKNLVGCILVFGKPSKKETAKKLRRKKMAIIFGIIALLVGALFVLLGVMPAGALGLKGRIICILVGLALIAVSIGYSNP